MRIQLEKKNQSVSYTEANLSFDPWIKFLLQIMWNEFKDETLATTQ